jgi:hypothetical protein
VVSHWPRRARTGSLVRRLKDFQVSSLKSQVSSLIPRDQRFVFAAILSGHFKAWCFGAFDLQRRGPVWLVTYEKTGVDRVNGFADDAKRRKSKDTIPRIQ